HYYNPPHLLPGVELIRSDDTADSVIDSLDELYRSIGKNPAHIQKEVQGFVGNRLQVAVLREAFEIIGSAEESAESLDSQVRDSLGNQLARSGPFGIVAERGIDSVLREAEDVFPTLCNDRELPPVLMNKIESGELGVKVRKGFYEWTDDSAEAWRKNMADSLLELATADQ
ncbi:MAG: 3-hydroxyacyl-CoA dehydrogenase family protein, partial [Chloroflexota bacterium]